MESYARQQVRDYYIFSMDRRSLIIKEIKIMPELPEVDTVLSALKTVMLGQIIKTAFVGRKDLRWPLPKNLAYRIEGRFVEGLERRGKYILIRLEGEEFLLIHLGMSGSIRIHESQPSPQLSFMMTFLPVGQIMVPVLSFYMILAVLAG